MDGDLAALVRDSAAGDDALSDDATLFVWAAMDGDDEVDDLVSGLDAEERAQILASAIAESRPERDPAQVYLTDVTVEGFRGIGPRTTLPLVPGPGLTVVAGRNGSGKSSFAEAVEFAVTSASYRWANRQKMYEKVWRNIQHPATCEIGVRMTEAGSGVTTLSASWATGVDDLGAGAFRVQRAGRKVEQGTASLGWERALELYRPFLSYAELGDHLNTTPSALYDAIHSVLGLEQLTDAQDVLDGAVKRLGKDETDANALRSELKAAVAQLDDERAATTRAELARRAPDIELLASLAVGGLAGNETRSARLSRLSRLNVPASTALDSAITRYRAADEQLAAASAGVVEANAHRVSLLAQALAHRAEHGTDQCPVCGIGELDEAWAERTRAEISENDAAVREHENARRAHAIAGQELARLLAPIPADLIAEVTGPSPLPSAQPALDAWTAWSNLKTAASVAECGESVLITLADAVDVVRTDAAAEGERLHDAWQPIALRLAAWVPLARAAEANKDQLKAAREAQKWLRSNADELRNDRLKPLSTRAQKIWATLRERSNVNLTAIKLSGIKTSRRVELAATVDDDEVGALDVMSQGERNALALSLFLPRVEMADSPFGFVQIDDPVQAMDPSKVDGLALVLHDLAKTRQVIVYTHDDRLPEAIRRLELPATILGVTRSESSVVAVREESDPVSSYLDDARVLARDEDFPLEVRRRVVPGLCRSALERRCREIFYRRELGTGASRSDVERRWIDASTTKKKLMLIVARGEHNLDRWVAGGTYRKIALGVCTSAPHNGYRGDPIQAVSDVRRVVEELKTRD